MPKVKAKKQKPAKPAATPPNPTLIERMLGRRFSRLMRRPTMRRAALAMMGLVAIGGGIALLGGPSGIARGIDGFIDARMEKVTKSMDLRLNIIKASGRDKVTRQMLAAHVPYELGTSMLKVEPGAVQASVEKIAWVRDAEVQIRWPDTLIVRINEREPIAVWKIEGQVYLIDIDGEPLAAARADDINRFPQVVGTGANTAVDDILSMLERNLNIGERVEAAIRVHGRRWNLRLRNGVDIKLPEEDAEEALERFAGWYGYNQVLSGDVISVDLRLRDKWFTKLTPRAAWMRTMPGQDT